MIKKFYDNYQNPSVCCFLVPIRAIVVKRCHCESGLLTPDLNQGKTNMKLTETGVWQVENSFVTGTNTIWQGGPENGLNTYQELDLKENMHLMTCAESTTIELVCRMDNNCTPKDIL